MNKREIEFLKRAEPMTWFMAFIGVFVYGAPMVYLNHRDGWFSSLPLIGMSIWGFGICGASLYFLFLTFKAKKEVK